MLFGGVLQSTMFRINRQKNKKSDSKSDKTEKSKRFQRHFRKFHSKETTGHPSYVYDENGKVYKVIGITSGRKTNDILNIRLEKNPEPNNPKPAYIQPKTKEVSKGAKNERLKGWKFSDVEKKKVQEVIDKNEKKK